MPRTGRRVLPGVPHHVILRGNNRRRLFSYPRDYGHFVFLMRKQLEPGDLALNAFCLMSNHIHLLATPREESALASFVKGIAQRYAQIRNRRFRGSGKLFEERFYSKAIRSEQHLALATAYIDLNPVRAGISKAGGDYRWSTFATHTGSASAHLYSDLWSPSSWYEGLARDRAGRAAAYRTWIKECVARDDWKGVQLDPGVHSGPPPRRPDRSRAAG